jgi:hypothetical protein
MRAFAFRIELDRPMPVDRLPANGRLVTNFTADSLRYLRHIELDGESRFNEAGQLR